VINRGGYIGTFPGRDEVRCYKDYSPVDCKRNKSYRVDNGNKELTILSPVSSISHHLLYIGGDSTPVSLQYLGISPHKCQEKFRRVPQWK